MREEVDCLNRPIDDSKRTHDEAFLVKLEAYHRSSCPVPNVLTYSKRFGPQLGAGQMICVCGGGYSSPPCANFFFAPNQKQTFFPSQAKEHANFSPPLI